MAKQATTTTPDPELSTPLGPENPASAGKHPQAQQPQRPGGGGAPGTGEPAPQWSEEAKNQEKTSHKSRAESGTTAPRKV